MVKACYTPAVPNEKESTFLTYNDGARLFLVRLVTGTRGHGMNTLDGIQTRAVGWTVGRFKKFFLTDGSENLAVSHAVRTARDSQTADALDGILESEPTSRLYF